MDLQPIDPRNQILKILKTDQNLLAVSKLQPIEKIKSLADQGQIHFGENYVQEALEKIETLQELHLQWHLIGPLQKNKVKYLKNNFAYIHSVDSLALAELLSAKCSLINYRQKIFIQVNLAAESSKSGFSDEELVKQWTQLKSLPFLEIVGLMTMPPLENSSEKNRVYFRKLKTLGTQLNLHEFSMGTSQDYRIALEEGATWIRIGTVLFGDRPKKIENELRTK